MKTTILSLTALLTIAFLCPSQAANVLVTPTSLTNTSGVSEFFPAANMINDSGLSGSADFNNYTTITHGAAGAGNAWTTTDPNGAGDYFLASSPGTPAIFTMTLGASFELSDLVLWGYHFTSANGNEAREFTLGFSTDGGATFPTSTVVSFPLSTYAVANAATLNLGGTFTANAVQVNITDNHFGGTAPGGDRIGVGELKFIAIPEPGAFSLLGLVGFGLMLRRRR